MCKKAAHLARIFAIHVHVIIVIQHSKSYNYCMILTSYIRSVYVYSKGKRFSEKE